jgi:hypothetical protein
MISHPQVGIPDCTLATACFCLHDKNKQALSVEQITEKIETLLSIPVYLVIYCDAEMIPIIQTLRAPYDHLTVYKVTTLSDIWTFQYEEQVNKNRAISWPTRDARTGPESHLLTCNKPCFVLETIHQNPFKTSKFGWIDCFAGPNMNRIAEHYTPNMLPYILSNITDKYHIQVMNVCDKKYKQPENKREFYERYRYIVCGGMFTCGREAGLKILPRLQEIFVEATTAGWGHGEEMLHLEILDEFYDDIHRSYGDYGQILNNFIHPTKNLRYIFTHILRQYFRLGYNKECHDCGKALLNEIKTHRVSVDSDVHFQVAFLYYVATFYYKHDEAKAAAQYVLDICNIHPTIKAEWNKNPGFYKDQLQFATEVPEGF